MFLTRAVALLSVFTAFVTADLVAVAPYTGKHKPSCNSVQKMTGALVGSKIYTFGGCYAIPYIVNPDEEDDMFRNYNDHQNVTESSNVYDISKDEWSFETNTPRPLQGSSVTVIGKDIYFHNIHSKPRISGLDLWKYSTDTKLWTELPQLPFLIHGSLLTCQNAGKMYFMGSHDSSQRNIIQVQDVATGNWESPIFLDKRVNVKRIICHSTHISMIGQETKDDDNVFRYFGTEEVYTQNLIDAYYNGSVYVAENVNVTLGTRNYAVGRPQIAQLNEWFYTYLPSSAGNETIITKINSLTRETVKLDTLLYTLANVLILPTENDEIYLFGGAKETHFGRSKKQVQDPSLPKIKTYNHKLIITVKETEEIVQEAEVVKQENEEHHLNLQVPNN